MKRPPVAWLGLAVGLVIAGSGRATEPSSDARPAEVRVLSAPGSPTVLSLQASPGATIEDRSVGARPATAEQGMASVGETFGDEITFVVRGVSVARAGSLDVEDALVSTVRLFPHHGGTLVTIFVRQPVSYAIARPTAGGAVAITIRPRRVDGTKAASMPAPGATPPPAGAAGGDEVAVDAAELQYDQQANVLIARGGVTLTRGGTTLRADEVRYDRGRSVAEARGHVVIVDAEATIEGDAARLDLTDETGWMDAARGDMRQSPYRLTAGRVEKKGGPCYEIRDGTFTSCRCGGVEPASWSITARDTDVTLQGIGVARDATFRIQDVPVLYLPWLAFPANTDRQSGLLFPRFGFSSQRGFLYQQPIYWAIDKSSDATITPVIETSARIGVIGEYRYVLSKRSSGVLTGGYFDDSIGGSPEPITTISTVPQETPTNRWIVAARHLSRLSGGTTAYLDAVRVSDDEFFREIRAFSSNVSGDIQLRSTRYTRARLGVVDGWAGGGVQAELASYQDLIDPQRFALNQLPRITAEQAIPLLGGRLIASLPAQTVLFQREAAYQGFRADLAPELLLPFRYGNVLFGSVRGRARETVYQLTDDEIMGRFVPDDVNRSTVFRRASAIDFASPAQSKVLDTTRTREIGDVQARIGTELARVYDVQALGLTRLRHTIEPELQYLFVPQVGHRAREIRGTLEGVPGTLFSGGYLFDEVDAINRRNFVSYGVTSRLLGRTGDGLPTLEVDEAAEGASDDDRDDDEEQDDVADAPTAPIEEIDPDTVPQGLPAAALPSFGRPVAGSKPGRARGGVRELVRASVLHGFDISRDLAPGSHFSTVDAQLRVTPVDWLGLSYQTSIAPDYGRAVGQTVGAVLREPWWSPPADRVNFQSPSSIGVAYRYVAGGVNAFDAYGSPAAARLLSNPPTEGIDGSLYLRLTDFVGFGFLARYDLSKTKAPDPDDPNLLIVRDGQFLERDYFVRVASRCACWLLDFGVSERADTNDTTFRVQFTLYGLGSFGQGPINRSFPGLAGLQNMGFRRPQGFGGASGFGGW